VRYIAYVVMFARISKDCIRNLSVGADFICRCHRQSSIQFLSGVTFPYFVLSVIRKTCMIGFGKDKSNNGFC
jgi:hypothetical protein